MSSISSLSPQPPVVRPEQQPQADAPTKNTDDAAKAAAAKAGDIAATATRAQNSKTDGAGKVLDIQV